MEKPTYENSVLTGASLRFVAVEYKDEKAECLGFVPDATDPTSFWPELQWEPCHEHPYNWIGLADGEVVLVLLAIP